MHFQKLPKLTRGDKVAVLSPSFAAPAVFPKVFELGLERLRSEFGLIPVEYPTTRKLNASVQDKSEDLITAFEDPEIKAVFATIGGNDQVTYIKNLPTDPFVMNPKPFFGYSDNTHLMNFLWINSIPSYYGGAIMTQFAMQGQMDEFTKYYLNAALFMNETIDLTASDTFNEIGLDWANEENLNTKRSYTPNHGWDWDGSVSANGVLWGGCLESIDEMLRHGIEIPSLTDFETIVLITETSEEIPKAEYVRRVYRAFGELGILERIQAILVGRPKAWEFNNPQKMNDRDLYRAEQLEVIKSTVRQYNKRAPIVQNIDFGHTDPQVPMPLGKACTINVDTKSIQVQF